MENTICFNHPGRPGGYPKEFVTFLRPYKKKYGDLQQGTDERVKLVDEAFKAIKAKYEILEFINGKAKPMEEKRLREKMRRFLQRIDMEKKKEEKWRLENEKKLQSVKADKLKKSSRSKKESMKNNMEVTKEIQTKSVMKKEKQETNQSRLDVLVNAALMAQSDESTLVTLPPIEDSTSKAAFSFTSS